ncbi:hypothetical protein [Actinokineospora terrae]|uniref:Uncharacterized protein n=1 Tax=Actinokineospora terrae TaxID=155974 RepID=A0A1H9XHF2_9PSEU|nr:hypothetical protein [Actinokineospora terrae]SES45489.1 hypothetical protein SAMN04487818_11597 [Actinokineospora terrae]
MEPPESGPGDNADESKPAGRTKQPDEPKRSNVERSGIVSTRFPVLNMSEGVGAGWPLLNLWSGVGNVADVSPVRDSILRITSTAQGLTEQGILSSKVFVGIETAASSGKGLARIFDSMNSLQAAVDATPEVNVLNALAGASGVSSIVAWQNATSVANFAALGLKSATGGLAGTRLVDQLHEIAGRASVLTSWAAHQEAFPGLMSSAGAKAVAGWSDLVFRVPELPDHDAGLRYSVTAGSTALGLASADLLTTDDTDVALQHEAAEQVQREALQPWEAGRLQVAADLRSAIGQLDPTTPELLDGAWDDLLRQGPAAAVKAANCAIEVLDRVLRAAAPDQLVVAWHRSENRSVREWEDVDPMRGRPPHSMRVRYLMRDRVDMSSLAVIHVETFVALRSRVRGKLQAIKHASHGDVATVRSLTMTVESLLAGLLLPE